MCWYRYKSCHVTINELILYWKKSSIICFFIWWSWLIHKNSILNNFIITYFCFYYFRLLRWADGDKVASGGVAVGRGDPPVGWRAYDGYYRSSARCTMHQRQTSSNEGHALSRGPRRREPPAVHTPTNQFSQHLHFYSRPLSRLTCELRPLSSRPLVKLKLNGSNSS